MGQLKVLNRNVVLLPSDEVVNEAIRRSKFISKLTENTVKLNKSKCLPHITLHQFALPDSNLEKLYEVVETIVANTMPFKLNLNDYSLFGGTGLFWDSYGNGQIRKLHRGLVKAINPLREGYIMEQHVPFLTAQVDIGKKRRISLGRYGNPLAMGDYWPHVTLESCPSRKEAELVKAQLPADAMQFEATCLYVTPVGPNGTCPGGSLKKFSFSRL